MTVPERPVLVAPDSFKGTFRASEVAGAIGRGLERAGLDAARPLPGRRRRRGDARRAAAALGGETAAAEVHDPLGRPVRAGFGLIEDGGTAIVEMAAASGLGLRGRGRARRVGGLAPYGTGELIAAAVDAGAQVVLVAVGGIGDDRRRRGRARGDRGRRRPARRAARRAVRRAHAVRGRAARVRAAEGRRRRRWSRGCERASTRWPATLPRDPRGVPMTGARRRALRRAVGGARRRARARRAVRARRARTSTRACAPPARSSPARASSTSRRSRASSSARSARARARPACRCTRSSARTRSTRSASGSSTSSACIEATTLAELEAAGEALGRELAAGAAAPLTYAAAAYRRDRPTRCRRARTSPCPRPAAAARSSSAPGSFGTAVAVLLARGGFRTTLQARTPEQARAPGAPTARTRSTCRASSCRASCAIEPTSAPGSAAPTSCSSASRRAGSTR